MARAYRLGVARRIANGIIRALLRMGWVRRARICWSRAAGRRAAFIAPR